MMNWVEKIAPVVPMIQATTVDPPILPSQVKYCAGSLATIG